MTRPLMIFAAGFGTRMKPLTDACPKPLITVAGRALIDHALDLAHPAKAAPVVVNAHYKAEMVVDHFKGHDVDVVVEQPDILDTGGGLRNALPRLGSRPVATLNSDAVWADVSALSKLWEAWDPDRMDALLCVIPKAQVLGHKGQGDFDLSPGGLLNFRRSSQADYIYSGLQIIKPQTLDTIEDRIFSLKAVWERLASNGQLFGYVHHSAWCDVGHPGAIPIAERLIGDRASV